MFSIRFSSSVCEIINAAPAGRGPGSGKPMTDRLVPIPCQRFCPICHVVMVRSASLLARRCNAYIAARARGPLRAATVLPSPPPQKDDLMTVRSIAALLAFVLATAAVAQLMAQEAQPTPPSTTGQAAQPAPPPETVVAVVNGKKVTRADVIASAQTLPAEYQSKIDAIFPALIDRLVDL